MTGGVRLHLGGKRARSRQKEVSGRGEEGGELRTDFERFGSPRFESDGYTLVQTSATGGWTPKIGQQCSLSLIGPVLLQQEGYSLVLLEGLQKITGVDLGVNP